MATLLKKLWISYDLVYNELPDPRTISWPLVGKPHQGLLILSIYAFFVLKWGPEWMKTRRPFNVDKLLIIYNIIQVAVCTHVFYELLVNAWAWHYQWVCEPTDFSDNPRAMKIANSVYNYYLIKYLDLADTIFFVVRKKSNQVSFLHVFHHFIMVTVAWGAITYMPGGHGTFIVFINSFVHMVMYSYYLLTVIHPTTKESLWWKKHLTQLQIVQLALCCFHLSLLLVTPNCGHPRWPAALLIPSDFFLLCLFIDFYVKNYINPKSKDNVRRTNERNIETKTEKCNNVIENEIIPKDGVMHKKKN